MKKLKREDLFTLEEYAEKRPAFRAEVLEHKKSRQVALDPHLTLYFEDRMTIQYQVQEMLRVERIFEKAGIDDELGAYNPLIPGGSNWKATFMIEYPEVEERRRALAGLIGVEDKVWVRVAGHDKVYAIADEDLGRETEEKTSSVHFMRFELDADMIAALRGGATLAMGCDHENATCTVDPVAGATRKALIADLD